MTDFPEAPGTARLRYGRWLAAMAACAAVVLLAVLPRQRSATPARPNIATPLSSTDSAIARLSFEPASPFPAWMSPTGSLLDAP